MPSEHTQSGNHMPPTPEASPSTTAAVTPVEFTVEQVATNFMLKQSSGSSRDLIAGLLANQLKTPRLNAIHHHLWLAGLPTAARPLHRQKLLGRTILITEDPDEHLVWFEDRIFVKPLPDYLLDWNSWRTFLCKDQELYEAGCGLILSYAWLVRYKSDLKIAKETGLLCEKIEWIDWANFINTFLEDVDYKRLRGVNRRYQYGELRLSRLNAIYRYLPPSYSFHGFIKGYQSRSTWYRAFFDRHFRWMLAVFAILSVILSALQVGLATISLQGDASFQNTSYGFTIASLVAVAAGLTVVFLVWFGLLCYHLVATWLNNRDVTRRRSEDRSV